MSHKVTFKSDFTDSELVRDALTAAKYSFTESGNVFRITSGPYNRATINTSTGEVVGDTDFHNREQFGALRQVYSEAEFMRKARISGVTIESRQVLADGRVKLVCSSFG